jgi:hypothetical protein
MADDIPPSNSPPAFRGRSSLSGLNYFWVYFTDLLDAAHCVAKPFSQGR